MKKISLITVYNNKDKLKEMLDSATIQKNVEIDYVLIDNTENTFLSASSALNFGVRQSAGDVLCFSHQDIVFLDDSQLNKIYDYAINNPNTIFGPAGVVSREKDKTAPMLSSMCEGEYKSRYNSLTSPSDCFTLDECLIVCHRSCMEKISFDEVVCDGWHLYGVDLCLQAHLTNEINVVAFPMNIWHKSHGNTDKAYFITLNKVADKYKDSFKQINSTNGYIYTNPIRRTLQNIYRSVKYRDLLK